MSLYLWKGEFYLSKDSETCLLLPGPLRNMNAFVNALPFVLYSPPSKCCHLRKLLKAGASLLPACLRNTNQNKITLHTPTNTLCIPQDKSPRNPFLETKTFCAEFRKKKLNCDIALELTSFISVTRWRQAPCSPLGQGNV